ncbi:glutaredoxin domain-containing protein [Mycobacteroides abscessus]|nr:glutaredoxin domain-containing protein [Mycobacteroides abscessus]QSM04198.1 NrdH-like glutaredoxin [Mycobacterium phage prophiGD51-2]AMU55783.1 hypothetical protein A3O02_11850 [Mycobacteroides abscessus]MBE5436457.1 hypothetical protein [Mycobacteroides abscessus]MBN7447543.1 NrdH-redoxin [Mycobacteroides abscessus subsp. abscessus]MDM1901615.1 glutaredoxin domain-containing protein [Mycobacteroides abscessus]
MTVTVYTLPACAQCQMTKKQLVAHQIPYREVRLDVAGHARERLRELGYATAPVVETPTGELWGGFRIERIRAYAETLSDPAA